MGAGGRGEVPPGPGCPLVSLRTTRATCTADVAHCPPRLLAPLTARVPPAGRRAGVCECVRGAGNSGSRTEEASLKPVITLLPDSCGWSQAPKPLAPLSHFLLPGVQALDFWIADSPTFHLLYSLPTGTFVPLGSPDPLGKPLFHLSHLAVHLHRCQKVVLVPGWISATPPHLGT